ncbi:homeobox domain protein [Teladorsagia circumcincta]|uniref:Homeobox domain protein n=1 Tax=Teladorsagia circumcincta TaxID=45464 RepID=A0A2G9UIJ3_TELCI|nr:homeobox domain protein [Teladorsagia circumcincta]
MCEAPPSVGAVFFADPATRLETNGDGELVPQRRERYVFRPILIKVLEGFFTQSPFPDLHKRVEIATACNQVLQIEKRGVGLMPKEVVSPQVVANWFANKRKELRRRSQEASEQTTAVAGPASGSQPHTPGQAGTEEATSSGVGSTPSPIMEEAETMDQTEVETRPLDVMALAARLGIAFPQLAAAAATSTADTSSGETPYSQALPIATLASHLLAASQNLTAPFSGGSANSTSSESQTTPATAATEASQLAMASLASQLLPTTTPSSLSLIAPGFQMLNTQLPVLNELCNNEQQQLDTPSEHNLLSMTYDQLHPPATLILHCDFLEGSLPLEAADAVIFDIGLFHSLWGIRGCVAEYLDGGFGRLVWCVTHIISLTVSLPFAFVSRPRPCFLWPLLIQNKRITHSITKPVVYDVKVHAKHFNCPQYIQFKQRERQCALA